MYDRSHLTLRNVLETLDSRSAGRRLPQEVEDKFFSLIKVGNDIAKKTYAHRLDPVNEIANHLLPNVRPLRIMDIGISSGVSTLEWVESLEQKELDYHMDAVDLMVRGILIGLRENVDVLADITGRPLLIDLNGKWIPVPPGKRHLIRYFFQLLIIRGVLQFVAPELTTYALNGKAQDERRWFTASMVPLVYSELRNHPRVTVSEGNFFKPASLPANLHVVRAANILNRSYFTDRQLSTIVQNLRGLLCENGLLVICKTDDSGRTAGTVFKVAKQGVEIVKSINGGSEIEELVCRNNITTLSDEHLCVR